MGMLSDLKSRLKKPIFYVTLCACLLAAAGLALYASQGKTQYNGNQLTQVIVYALIAAIVFFVLALLTGSRWFHYGALLATLYAFLEYVITEVNFWTNWILATDPVAPNVLTQYFLITGILLLSTVGALVAAGMAKKSYYLSAREVK